MKIDWAALGIVGVISIVATVLFVTLLSGGIRLLAPAPAPSSTAPATSPPTGGHRTAGYLLLGLAGLLVLFGIYLIVPFPS